MVATNEPIFQESLSYVNRNQVEGALARLDSVEIAREVFLQQSESSTVLPDEAYMGWTNSSGFHTRSLAMPGMLGGTQLRSGVKIINSSLGNHLVGKPRADGLLILFDSETGFPLSILEGASISARRTAAVSVTAVEICTELAIDQVAIVGCGRQGWEHLQVLLSRGFKVGSITIFDTNDTLSKDFVERAQRDTLCKDLEFRIGSSVEEVIRGSSLIILTTTVTKPYVDYKWIDTNAVLLNVSLDDLGREEFLHAGSIIVDSWDLIINDEHRMLGHLCRGGEIRYRDEEHVGSISDYITGSKELVRSGYTIINPFGMSIHDIALGYRVFDIVRESGELNYLKRQE